jgi:pimeloyl-ACP methyl ester carboxylesterase
MVITGVLARIPEKVRAMIYLDAFVPEDGKAMIDYIAPESQVAWNAFRDADTPLPPLSVAKLGLTDPTHIEFVAARLVPQPWRSFYQPVKALKQRPRIPMAYIRCTQNPAPHFAAMLETMKADPDFVTDAIDAGHTCMLTEPAETVRLLEKYGA